MSCIYFFRSNRKIKKWIPTDCFLLTKTCRPQQIKGEIDQLKLTKIAPGINYDISQTQTVHNIEMEAIKLINVSMVCYKK